MAELHQICRRTQKSFVVTDEDQSFYQKIGPIFDGRSFPIPLPTLCPEERKRQRLGFRNLRHLYLRTCDKTGQNILSVYHKDAPYTVYANEAWWSDQWHALDYGRDFDFKRPFFEQFEELFKAVPHPARAGLLLENCDYVNGASKCKNCYLSFNMDYCEDCYYLTEGKHSKDCMDSFNLVACELCYEGVDLERCYNVQYSTRSTACVDSYFLMDCRQCRNCIGCVNLVGKDYFIFNQKVSPEEFNRYKEAFKSRKFVEEFKAKFQNFSLQYPRKYYFGHANENFSGNNLQNVKNTFDAYNCFNLENCKFCYFTFNAANCMDYDIFGDHSEWIYNCLTTGINCSNNISCMHTWNGSSNNLYCFLMSGASNNFGCVGLKQQKYCLLNKQYTQNEYEKLAARVIEHMQKTGEWGEFFPASICPFAYNESQASEILPLNKAEALALGYRWKEDEAVVHSSENYADIPDHLGEIDESWANRPLPCSESGKLFKIIPQELSFYKKLGIPLPKVCPERRHQKRFAQELPQKLWLRQCAKDSRLIWTGYAPDRPEIVYCEACYLKAVY